MNCLVIGGSGLIGSALVKELSEDGHDVEAPSRDELDLSMYGDFVTAYPPDIVFLCAGIKGIKPNETDRIESWRVNVDGTLAVGRAFMRAGALVVFVSSDAVEWLDSHYTRQKLHVEAVLQGAGDPIIVRPSNVSKERAPEFARFMIGLLDKPGTHYWS